MLIDLHRSREAREAAERGLALNPRQLNLIESKVVSYIQEGDLADARLAFAVLTTDLKAAYVSAPHSQRNPLVTLRKITLGRR